MSSPRLLAAMAAHLPRLPFLLLLFVFLAVHVPASHGQPPKLPATYDPSMCSNSAKCGGVDITYPFYLSTGIREIADYSGNNYSCGYSDLEISCQDVGETKIPIIQLDQDKYIIQHIFYDTTTIILGDSDVLGGPPDPCPRVRHNVTFDKMWLHYNASSYDNLTFFFDCDPMLTGGFDMGKNYTINCTGSSSSSGGGVSFVFTAEDLEIAQEHELAARCSENVIVPVQRDALMKNDPNMLARGHYIEVLQAELEWNRPTTTEAYQCYGCEGSGGRCAYGQSKVFLGCLCSEGKVGNPNCKNSGDTSKAHASRRRGQKPEIQEMIVYSLQCTPKEESATLHCVSCQLRLYIS